MKFVAVLLWACLTLTLRGQSLASVPNELSFTTTFESVSRTYDFNTGLPAGTAVYGTAAVNANTGILELNPNVGSQQCAFLVTDLAPGRLVRGFTARFQARMVPGSPTPGDGFSFNWAPNLPNGPYATGEEGAGTGLTVAFDTFDNGPGEAPAIEVKWNSNVVAHYACPLNFLVTGDFVDVRIDLYADGTLDLSYNSQNVYSRLSVNGYTPLMGARFGFGSRTGAAWETHDIDDLGLELFIDSTNGVPVITSITKQPPSTMVIAGTGPPAGNVALQASADLRNWFWRARITPDADGRWQSIDGVPGISSRFYRLLSFPQMPTNLVNWWRAEGNYLDSFGNAHGSSTNLGFTSGRLGQAFNFNVTNQMMNIGQSAISVPWTAAFWVNRQDAFGQSAALLTGTSSALKLEQVGAARLVGFTAFGVADYSFNYAVPANEWVNLTFVALPGETVLYANGVPVASHAATVSLPRGVLGSRATGADQLRGLVDEIVLFSRALSPTEIQQVLNATRWP